MSDCRIRLFGPPTVTRDGLEQTGLRSKSLALLAFLVVENRSVARDTVATLFWRDSDQSSARRNLRPCVHELRRLLPDDALRTDGGRLLAGK